MKDRINAIRKEASMNQEEFAEALGVSVSIVKSWCIGRRTPSSTAIFTICEKFRVRREWLENGTGEMRDIPAPTWQSDADLVTALLESESDPVASIVRSIMQAYIQMDAGERESAKKFALAILTEIKKDKGES